MAAAELSPLDQIAESARALKRRGAGDLDVGLILGTGLGDVAQAVESATVIPYSEIPHFLSPTANGHCGRLTVGILQGRRVAVLQGRSHLYEGVSPVTLALPVRVLAQLGMKTLIVTNAAGGLRPDHQVGDIVVIDDHLNMMFANPLIGRHEAAWGPMFPDMSRPYDRELSRRAIEIARQHHIPATLGVYAAVSGPNYETRAEMRMYRRFGADAIGMSTVPEVIAASQRGLRVLGLSTITNVCLPDACGETDGESVAHAACTAAPRVATILREILRD